jgi:hypothetical protein
MTDDPVNLDEHRGIAAQKGTEIRRRSHEVRADQAAIHQRQEEFESFLLLPPAKTLPEALIKVRYLLQLFTATPEAQSDARLEKLIATTLEDLDLLAD